MNAPEPAALPSENHSCRVLCVDDNHDAADTTAQMLHAHGFDARACYDGPSALRMAEVFRPHLCFIDLNMPGMEGDELAVHLRQLTADRPPEMVALTAMSTLTYVLRTEAAGFSRYLVKPANPEVLVEIAKSVVV